jgi:hypothetical protein
MKAPIAKLVPAFMVVLINGLAFAQADLERRPSPLDEAFEFYQEYSGRTVLRSPNLPTLSEFNKPIHSIDTNGMKVVLENELAKHGIEFVPLNEVFALAVENGWKNSAAATYITSIAPSKESISHSNPFAAGEQKSVEEKIPPGTIDFGGADLNQFLDLYGMLINRNILRSMQFSSSTFKLRSQTSLTKNDAIYMSKILLALNGIASVEDGANFVQVVPLKQVANLKLQAPVRDPNEPLIDPEKIRTFGFGHLVSLASVQTSRQGAVNDLVAYYAELTGRISVTSKQVGGMPIVFRAQRPMTKPELLYALETSLSLNGLAIVEVNDQTIRAGYIQDRNQAKK